MALEKQLHSPESPILVRTAAIMKTAKTKLAIAAVVIIALAIALIADLSWAFGPSRTAKLGTRVLDYLTGEMAVASVQTTDTFWPSTIDRLQQKILGQPVLFIGHAGGGYKNSTYTNSLEALNQNYSEGLRFFEIDFSRTKDGKIVCIHDWRGGYLTYDEFKQQQYNQANFLMKFNNCDVDSLGEFLSSHPDAYLVLDTKIDEEKEHKEDAVSFFREITRILTEKYEVTIERIVPQAYSLEQTKQYKTEGYPHVIFTVYKVKGPKVYDEACKLNGVAITAPVNWIIDGRVKVSEESEPRNCPIFVHPVEKLDQLAPAMKIAPQVRGIYTSFLRPE